MDKLLIGPGTELNPWIDNASMYALIVQVMPSWNMFVFW